jgi:quercetin dioxygenase-like cupin family protein
MRVDRAPERDDRRTARAFRLTASRGAPERSSARSCGGSRSGDGSRSGGGTATGLGAAAGHRLPLMTVCALLAVTWMLAACGLAQTPAGTTGTAGPSTPAGSAAHVVRDVLAAGQPSVAPDENLELVRYTIAPHTALAPHHHPGMQLALIESGRLTYSVIEGTITIHETDGSTRTIGPGETGTIEAGEWIAETESIVHFGANDTDSPVVILAASLLAADEPPAIPVSPAPSG